MNHITVISIRPRSGDFNPKKRKDQKAFSESWMPNTVIDFLTLLFSTPVFQTMKSEIPIKRYSVVHTGAKTEFGGVKAGFLRLAYQLFIAGVVNREPIMPATSHSTTKTAKRT